MSLLIECWVGATAGTRIRVLSQRPVGHPPRPQKPRTRRILRTDRQLVSEEHPVHQPVDPPPDLQPVGAACHPPAADAFGRIRAALIAALDPPLCGIGQRREAGSDERG